MRGTVYMKKQYDYLLVGSGLFAGVFAYYANYPYLNTPVLKSIFVRGAQRNPALTYPNREFGYGTLDLYEAFLHLRNL